MRLRDWIDAPGTARTVARLCRDTGLSYPTVHGLYWQQHRARYETAKAISEATDGAVTIAELCETPRRRARVRSRKRRRPRSVAPASKSDSLGA